MMKTVPGGLFPMASEKIADVYGWLTEQLNEIGLEEFHVRSIVAYFFMNNQDLEDESSQACGISPLTNGGSRRQTSFDVTPLQDRRKRCAESYIKNVSSKESVPVAIVKRIVAELSARLTAGTQDTAAAYDIKPDHQTKSTELNSDSPVDRYNKAFPPLSEDNSPVHLSPPDNRENVWSQRRPLTSKLAGETSQKNGAIDRQPSTGTKLDPPSRKTKIGHGKENDLMTNGHPKKKTHISRRREPIQYSSAARQLSYPSPHGPSETAGSLEDEARKSQIAEYLINALGINSPGNVRRANFNNNEPSVKSASTHHPPEPQQLRKVRGNVDGPSSHSPVVHSQEARLPAHMFPEQLASKVPSVPSDDKGEKNISEQKYCTSPTASASSLMTSSCSAYISSSTSSKLDQVSCSATPILQQEDYPQCLKGRWPHTQVTITEDERHMFAAFSPRDESLPSGNLHILPYELLERDNGKKLVVHEVGGDRSESATVHGAFAGLCGKASDVQILSSSLPASLHLTEGSENLGSSDVSHPADLISPMARASLRESQSYPCLELTSLHWMSACSVQPADCQSCGGSCLYKHVHQQRQPQDAFESNRTLSNLSFPFENIPDPSDLSLEQWIQYMKHQSWSHAPEEQTHMNSAVERCHCPSCASQNEESGEQSFKHPFSPSESMSRLQYLSSFQDQSACLLTSLQHAANREVPSDLGRGGENGRELQFTSDLDQNTQYRGVLCGVYSPLDVEDVGTVNVQQHSCGLASSQTEDSVNPSLYPTIVEGSLKNGLSGMPWSGDPQGIWSHSDGVGACSQLFSVSFSDCKSKTSCVHPDRMTASEGRVQYRGPRDHSDPVYCEQWHYQDASKEQGMVDRLQSPFGFGLDIHRALHGDGFGGSLGKDVHQEPSATAYSSLPEEAGAVKFTRLESPLYYTFWSDSSQQKQCSHQQFYADFACQTRDEQNEDQACFETPSQHQEQGCAIHKSNTFKQSHSAVVLESRGEETECCSQSQHSEQDSDPELQLLASQVKSGSQEWQTKQEMLGIDSHWLTSSSTQAGKGHTKSEENCSRASGVVDPFEDEWFPPWLQAGHSNNNQSRIFPRLRDCSVKRPSPSTSISLLPPASFQLDRSASDSTLNIPSASSAFRPYVRSSSFPSLRFHTYTTSHKTAQQPATCPKDHNPREEHFRPIPADVLGRPIETEHAGYTYSTIQTVSEAQSQPEQPAEPQSPESPDSDVSSHKTDIRLQEKSWKEMQDVTEEDQFADALYYYQQYGLFPSPQEAEEDLLVMEQAAASDYFFPYTAQMNGYVASCAVPIPRHALRLEQVEEELLQSSSAHSSHKHRRKPSKHTSRAKHPRGGVHSRRPCTFFLEGQCYRADCKYSHDMSTTTCYFWEGGQCLKGDLCPFLHGYSGNDERADPTLRGAAEPAQPVIELTSEDFPALSGAAAQDVVDHNGNAHKKKKVKKSGVRNQIPRGN